MRLVACDPAIATDGELQFANYQIEDWSGYQFQPPNPDGDSGNNIFEVFDPGPSAFFGPEEPAHEGQGCVATTYKSLNPGLARIRVDVRSHDTGQILFSHQFIVIWLQANAPTLHEAGLTAGGSELFQQQLDPYGQRRLANLLGDPLGDGMFTPSPFDPSPSANEDKGLIQVRVTGSFPVVKESPLSMILKAPTYTLPSDWSTLASTLASSAGETEPPGANPGLWDIHGTAALGDAYNEGGPDALEAAFRRAAFSDFTEGATKTIGPFDPEIANETLLSDGQLNEDDAPMPPMRVDVSIEANSPAHPTGGVGRLEGASKAVVYSHDFTGASTPGNLYNPYYGAYIPATDRPASEASGITGPSPGGDFPGFLNEHPAPYEFWHSVLEGDPRESHSTKCLRSRIDDPSYYETPGGYRTDTVYSDERGEAYLVYTPGNQFYLENLLSSVEARGKLIHNSDGGCDLKGLFGQPIGESSITARAVYPYEPVDYAPPTSEPLVKRITSLWEKEFFDFEKGPGENEQGVRIVAAKARDIDGSPFADEEVCFYAQGGGILPFLGSSVLDTEGVLGLGRGEVKLESADELSPLGPGWICEATNANGLAAIEVVNSTTTPVDVTVDYADEGIVRDHSLDFAAHPPEELSAPATIAAPISSQPLYTPLPSVPPTSAANPSRAAPLTATQQLHLALTACKRHSSSKLRRSCEAAARKVYDTAIAQQRLFAALGVCKTQSSSYLRALCEVRARNAYDLQIYAKPSSKTGSKPTTSTSSAKTGASGGSQ